MGLKQKLRTFLNKFTCDRAAGLGKILGRLLVDRVAYDVASSLVVAPGIHVEVIKFQFS